MPTGYTAYIEDGTITTAKDFIMLCTRAFGALIDMRDEPLSVPIPKQIEANTKFDERMVQYYKNELAKYESLTPEQIHELNRFDYEKRVASRKKSLEEKINIKKRYEQILSDVESWIPPTSDHVELKNFVINQITMSIPTDEEISYLAKEEVATSDDKWVAMKISTCKEGIDSFENHIKVTIENAKKRNDWLNAVRDSFKEG